MPSLNATLALRMILEQDMAKLPSAQGWDFVELRDSVRCRRRWLSGKGEDESDANSDGECFGREATECHIGSATYKRNDLNPRIVDNHQLLLMHPYISI